MKSNSNVEDLLLSHVRELRDDKWDSATLRKTKLCLLDSLTCFSTGRSLQQFVPHVAVADRFLQSGTNGERPTPSPFAIAYLYGQAANALDFDDTLVGHPGSAIIGAILAVGIENRLSTDQLLRGIAGGYEAHWILGTTAAPTSERATQVRSVGVWDTVAASIGVCIALGLDDQALKSVIGIAAAHSILPYTAKWYERPVPAIKNNLGWVAAGAIMSAELVLAGQTGLTNVLDGHTGMWRMAGSDRLTIEPNFYDRPAVLRVGFKQFPACWHIQEHVRTFSHVLTSLTPGDEILEIVIAGPPEIEKFCEPDIFGTADIAFSLPAIFSLLISGVEPGPRWGSFHSTSHELRFRDLFRYQPSTSTEICIRTKHCGIRSAPIANSDSFDLGAWGLDENGVIAKHDRLTDTALRTAAASAVSMQHESPLDGVPTPLYQAVGQMSGLPAGTLIADVRSQKVRNGRLN